VVDAQRGVTGSEGYEQSTRLPVVVALREDAERRSKDSLVIPAIDTESMHRAAARGPRPRAGGARKADDAQRTIKNACQ
jgi:hypothetical protein